MKRKREEWKSRKRRGCEGKQREIEDDYEGRNLGNDRANDIKEKENQVLRT